MTTKTEAKSSAAANATDALRARAKRVTANWQACLIILGVAALIGVWRLIVVARHPNHLRDIATETGSVAEFWGQPMPNPSGTRILFQQSTETGVGVFFADIPNGKKAMLYEQPEKGFEPGNVQLWGWSSDGSRFAYLRRPNKEAKRELIVGDGYTGEAVGTVLMDRKVEELTWLSPQSFVFVDDYQDLFRVEQLSEKRWGVPQPFKRPEVLANGKKAKRAKLTKEQLAALPPVENIIPTSASSVAYLCEHVIWNWEFNALEPVQIWSDTNHTLVDFSVDALSQRLLLHSKDDTGEKLWAYHWPTKRLTPLGENGALKFLTNRVVWFNGDGYAYVQRGLLNHAIQVRSRVTASPVEFKFNGGLNSFAANNREIYAFGSIAGEPVGIWQLAADSEKPTCVVSNPMPSFTYAKVIVPIRETVTNESGQSFSYRLWSPTQLVPGRKYPLLIGKATTRWQGYAAAIAQGGAYFLSIEQDEEDGDWGEKVMPLYEQIKTKFQVDEEQLYLYATSRYTWQLKQLLEAHAGKWRGAILFSPAGLLDPTKLGVSRLLVDYGAEDLRADLVAKFRDDAARVGVAVTVVPHENAGHIYRSVAAQRERDQAVIKFLFGR